MSENALRFNQGKPELAYPDMFPAALKGVALVYMYGTNRPHNPYPKYNFTKGAPFVELYNCARRHMLAWFNGEDMDPDAVAAGFDVNHIDSAIGNLMRLRQQIADRPELDDRPCKVLASPEKKRVPIMGPIEKALSCATCQHEHDSTGTYPCVMCVAVGGGDDLWEEKQDCDTCTHLHLDESQAPCNTCSSMENGTENKWEPRT